MCDNENIFMIKWIRYIIFLLKKLVEICLVVYSRIYGFSILMSLFTFLFCNKSRKFVRLRSLPSLPGIFRFSACFRMRIQCIVTSIKLTYRYVKHPVQSRNSTRRLSSDIPLHVTCEIFCICTLLTNLLF